MKLIEMLQRSEIARKRARPVVKLMEKVLRNRVSFFLVRPDW